MIALTHIQEARKALSKGSIPIALSEMAYCFDVLLKLNFKPLHIKEIHNDFIICSGRFNEGRKHELNGMVAYAISDESKNKIIATLLYLISKIEDCLTEMDATSVYLNDNNSILEFQKTTDIEIIINRNFQEYSAEDQNKFLNAIANLLSMNSGEIKIKSVKAGSVKIILSLPFEKAGLLVEKINSGALNEYNIQSIAFLEEQNSVEIDQKEEVNVLLKQDKFFKELLRLEKLFYFKSIFRYPIPRLYIIFGLILLMVTILYLFFGQIIWVLSLLILCIYVVTLYFSKRFACSRCGGKGIIEGDDPVLGIHFDKGANCYMCDGKKIPSKDRRSWNIILKKSVKKLNQLKIQEETLMYEIFQYRKSLNISKNTDEKILFAHNNILVKKYKQLTSLESEIKAYTNIYKQALSNIYYIHLINLMEKEQMGIKHGEDHNLDTIINSLSFVKDTSFLRQKDQDYLPLISEAIRKDMDAAVNEFQTLISRQKEK